MSMQPLYAQLPLGSFDGLDTEYLTLLGGEVVSLTSTSTTSSDKRAADVADGYSGTTSPVRPVVTKTLASGMRPLFLADEGVKDYGTMIGAIQGGVFGQANLSQASAIQVGPSTAYGSGKVTCWNYEGLYKVSLDAVDTTASTGLVPTNSSLVPGSALYATTSGKLTPNSALSFETNLVVARFVEFRGKDSKVTTPLSMVSAQNSPSGAVSNPLGGQFYYVVISWGVGK